MDMFPREFGHAFLPLMAAPLTSCAVQQTSLPEPAIRPHNTAMSRRTVEITTELMLRAYRHGLFPMAETRRGERLYWLDPERRGILRLDRFHLSRRLLRTALSDAFEVAADQDFPSTVAGCAAAAPG